MVDPKQRDDSPSETDESAPQAADEAQAAPEASSGETFKQGLSLLWKAARSAADEIKHEVERGGVRKSLEEAGRELESAAQQAAKALENLVERAGPNTPDYTDKWPPADSATRSPEASSGEETQKKTEEPEDEARAVRIKLDDDKPS